MPEEIEVQLLNILLVEDNPSDILLLDETLEEIGLQIDLHVVNDAEDALGYLHRRPPFTEAERPDIVLLDMNLPKTNGFKILEDIKQDPDLKTIPVIVLSTSDSVIDVERSYRLHANCFITKPNNLEEYMDKIESMIKFWMNTVNLPEKIMEKQGE